MQAFVVSPLPHWRAWNASPCKLRGVGHVCRRRSVRMVLPGVDHASLKVLVVGSGGREHALATALQASPYTAEVIVAPGNAGTVGDGMRRVPQIADKVPDIVELARTEDVDLAVIGPEVALVAGVVDELRSVGVRAFGPTQAAAALEGSKAFSKEFMARHGIPTAAYRRFVADEVAAARDYVHQQGAPLVVKADGLAAGKGVVVARTVSEALEAVDDALVEGRFGDAGRAVVIEEFLEGEELSFFAVCDGTHAVPLASAQDHKAAYDGDKGPNTGGMGAYSPAPVCDAALQGRIMDEVVIPTVRGMAAEGAPFQGVLFLGLMVDERGDFKLLEYNVRFGDPECQVLCTRLRSDMCELLFRATEGNLSDMKLEWRDEKAMVVVMASEGYPASYEKGRSISGIDEANAMNDVLVYHAGTETGANGVVNSGGRVLGVTAIGDSIIAARQRAYEAVRRIKWDGAMYRSDIGWRAVLREEPSVEVVS